MSESHIVVEGSENSFRHAIEDAGVVTEGFDGAGARTRSGIVAERADATAAVLAAVDGARVIVHALADREVVDQLLDDLRRLGPVEHRLGEPAPDPLTREERDLLALLAEGRPLGDAARELSISRRTADRRLSAARRALGVSTTAEAVVLFSAAPNHPR